MDIRVVAILLAILSTMAAAAVVGAVVIRGLIWLFEEVDPSVPLRAKVEARVAAIEATLRAVRLELIRIPRVYRRTVE
jgi:hypothetical protein